MQAQQNLFFIPASWAARNNRGNLGLDVAATTLRLRANANQAARFSFDGLQWHLGIALAAETRIVQPPRQLARHIFA